LLDPDLELPSSEVVLGYEVGVISLKGEGERSVEVGGLDKGFELRFGVVRWFLVDDRGRVCHTGRVSGSTFEAAGTSLSSDRWRQTLGALW
jgi:hypothetical protein